MLPGLLHDSRYALLLTSFLWLTQFLLFSPSDITPLPTNGSPVFLETTEKAVARTSDHNAALLITNMSRANTSHYTYIYGSTEEHGALPGGTQAPLYFIFNPEGERLAVSNTSNTDTVIRVALYSSESTPNFTLSPDGNPVDFPQYSSAGAELDRDQYYFLRLKAPEEISIFIVLGEQTATTLCVNVPSKAQLKCDKICGNNSASMCLQKEAKLYIVNSSPTSTSQGSVLLMNLSPLLPRFDAPQGCEYWDRCLQE